MNLATLKIKLLSLHRSFTNWFNVSGLIVLESITTYPDLRVYLTSKGLFAIIIVGNIILRVFKTTKAIEHK